MKKLAIFSIFCGFLAILWGGFFAPQVSALGPGDVNGNNIVNLNDIVYLVQYLYQDGAAPPNPIDADVDGSPGINAGDLLQLTGYLFSGCNLQPYNGVALKESKKILFYADPLVPMSAGLQDTSEIRIITNNGPDLMGMIIPISYTNQLTEVDEILDNVDFTGSIIPAGWNKITRIDNVNKRVLLSFIAANPGDPPIVAGTVGLVATLYFTKQVDGWSHTPSVTEYPPTHSFMLIKSFCADALNPPTDRIFTTVYHLTVRGDANCSGVVEMGDVVQLIRYLYFFSFAPLGL